MFLSSQLPALTNLQSLSLRHSLCSAHDYEPLLAATQLTTLQLDFAVALPGCLSSMTWLRSLELTGTPFETDAPAEWAPLLAAAVEPLTRLTHLYVQPTSDIPTDPLSVLAAAASLPRLHSLGWLGGDPSAAAPLPAEPWPHLRQLLLTLQLAAASTAVLMQVTQLESLTASGRGNDSAGSPQALLQLLEWAPTHPSLRQLTVDPLSPAVVAAAAAAAQAHPHLSITRGAGPSVDSMSKRAQLLARF